MGTTTVDPAAVNATPNVKTSAIVTATDIPADKPPWNTQLKVNESLENGQSLRSANARFVLINQEDGNIVLYDAMRHNAMLWNSNTFRKAAGKITMQADGNVVGVSWSTGTRSRGNANNVFIVQDDGNVVVLSDGKQIWQSGTQVPREKFDEIKPLKAGESLQANQALLSLNGRFRLLVQGDANLVLSDNIGPNGVLWSAERKTDNPRAVKPRLALGVDGNLVLFNNAAAEWSSNTPGDGDGSSTLSIQDDGDVVIRSRNIVIWSTGTKLRSPDTMDRLFVGESLRKGQSLKSPNNKYTLDMQSDGNLVLYDVKENNRAIWSSQTRAQIGAPRAQLRPDGTFVVYDRELQKWANSIRGNGDATSVLILQNDGEVIIRSKDTQIWNLGTKQSPGIRDRLAVGEILSRDEFIRSPNSKYQLTLKGDGNVVLLGIKENNRLIWSSGPRPSSDPKLSIRPDGNVVVMDGNTLRWSSDTAKKGDESTTLIVQDNGDVVLMSGDKKIWSTLTIQRFRTNALKAGEALRPTEALVSTNKRYKISIQNDGVLTILDTNPNGRVIWSTQIGQEGGNPKAVLQEDGNFVVDIDNEIFWSSGSKGSGAVLTMHDDGELVINSGGTTLWSSGTRNRK